MNDEHASFMDLAIEQARVGEAAGNVPVGSLIVRDGEVLGIGRNRVRSENDPTAHAEVDAIRDACAKGETTELSGATCYTTMEPCPMCCWALQEAGVAQLVLGARHVDLGRTDYGGYSVETLLALTARTLDLVTGVRSEECAALRRNWVAGRV